MLSFIKHPLSIMLYFNFNINKLLKSFNYLKGYTLRSERLKIERKSNAIKHVN